MHRYSRSTFRDAIQRYREKAVLGWEDKQWDKSMQVWVNLVPQGLWIFKVRVSKIKSVT